MRLLFLCSCLALGLLAGGCGGGDDDEAASVAFTPAQRLLADQIVSVFENDTPVIDYGYAEALDDGRGITAGRAGFTTATGDLLEVVERYAPLVPGNPLAAFLPRLRELAAEESGAVDGLEGLEAAWLAAAADPRFCEVQDEVVDDEYYWPAVAHADELGLAFPLSLLCLYDSCIQHGDGEDPDGLPALLERATEAAGGAPAEGVAEGDWLLAFLQIRRAVLLDPFDEETQEAWAESVGRVDALLELLAEGNLQLTPPIVIAPFGTSFTLPWP